MDLKSFGLYGLIFALLSSCVNLKGQLETFQEMTLKGKKGETTISVGEHKAKLRLRSKKKMTLTLTDGDNKKFDFKIPEGTKLPQDSGTITLSAGQTGQPYDLEGIVETQTSVGPTRNESEHCTITRRVRRCRTNRDGQRVCREEVITLNGRRMIQYHIETQNKGLVLHFYKQDQSTMGRFDGTEKTSRKIITRTGPCRI